MKPAMLDRGHAPNLNVQLTEKSAAPPLGPAAAPLAVTPVSTSPKRVRTRFTLRAIFRGCSSIRSSV